MMRLKLITAPMLAAALALGATAMAADAPIKRGLTSQDWAYKLADGVTTREVIYYSDGIACYAKLFFPKNFSADKKLAGVVLGQGWAGYHNSIEKYGARFAERGLVAMVIDYRGWGGSDGFPTVTDRLKNDDAVRFTRTQANVVIKRTRLLPARQVEDFRNAISYLQGEAGVDPARIGVWGSSFAGGHVITVAGQDARVKAVVAQIPGGSNAQPAPLKLEGALLADAIKRARTGQGDEYETGFSIPRMVDVETQQAVREYYPFYHARFLGERPILMVVAEKEELGGNVASRAAFADIQGPKKWIEVPDTTHFQMYIDKAFEISSNAAADWFNQHL
ncbi:MAG TPA: dienelactone hydrolase family protein [Povalibacter sp.]|uniref:alpha/beta hydrolase n=1 Tax=Povalibacter sp. TaxID=1962978 RepID=UPI002BCCE86F|nr:dienelactone hydrolase family protein [Povalibacter sp.]HMN43754.1 dienelactone hydrolase family protein [Povalibacter sp.]